MRVFLFLFSVLETNCERYPERQLSSSPYNHNTLKTLDMNSPELLHLTFSEPVRASSVDFTTITLQSVDNITLNGSEFYTLTNGTILSGNGLMITIRLDFFDVVSIQSRRQLAISEESTFVSLNSATFEDMNFNPSVNISSEAALPASGYTRDDTAPRLQAFSVNLDSGVITLTFTPAGMSKTTVSSIMNRCMGAPFAVAVDRSTVRA